MVNMHIYACQLLSMAPSTEAPPISWKRLLIGLNRARVGTRFYSHLSLKIVIIPTILMSSVLQQPDQASHAAERRNSLLAERRLALRLRNETRKKSAAGDTKTKIKYLHSTKTEHRFYSPASVTQFPFRSADT